MSEMKQGVYIKAVKNIPDYFVDDETRFAIIDATRMVVANPRFKAMWWDAGAKKPKWKIVDQNSPFEFTKDGSLEIKE